MFWNCDYFWRIISKLVQFHNNLKSSTLLNCKYEKTRNKSSLHQKSQSSCVLRISSLALSYTLLSGRVCWPGLEVFSPFKSFGSRFKWQVPFDLWLSQSNTGNLQLFASFAPSLPPRIHILQQARTFKTGSRSLPHVTQTQAAHSTIGVINGTRPPRWNATNDENNDNEAYFFFCFSFFQLICVQQHTRSKTCSNYQYYYSNNDEQGTWDLNL